jgi:hypothetical protein
MGLNRGTVTKLAIFNGALLAGNVLIFSNAFLKVRLTGGSALQSAIGFAVIAVSVVSFFYVNMLILNAPSRKLDPKAIRGGTDSLEACRETIARMGYSGTFSPKMGAILEQIQAMQKKRELINDILLQKFAATEMSYRRFKDIVDSAEGIMRANIKSILNRIFAFDEEEYGALARGKSRLRQNLATQKLAIYKEYIDFVDNAVEDNDEILLKLDKLLFEISKFNSIDEGALENMEAMKELDRLIADTKWYR